MELEQLKVWASTVNINGWLCQAKVTPYAWMYPGHAQGFVPVMIIAPVQSTSNGAFEEIKIPADPADITPAALRAAVTAWAKTHQSALIHCPRCSGPAWNRSMFPSQYRNDLCEDCWMSDHNAEWVRLSAEMDAKEKKVDLRHKASGFTHKTVAWVHPRAGGDDYSIAVYSRGALTDAEIKAMLVKKRSAVLDDYKQVAL